MLAMRNHLLSESRHFKYLAFERLREALSSTVAFVRLPAYNEDGRQAKS